MRNWYIVALKQPAKAIIAEILTVKSETCISDVYIMKVTREQCQNVKYANQI